MRQGYWLAKELYPGSTPIFWRRITILQALYKTLENPIQKNNLCVGTDFKSMVDELSKALHLPPIELVRELIDKPASCGLWAHYERESPIYQEALVKLAILFGSDLANTVYKKLHSEWAAWCDLSKAVDKEDAIVFYVRQGIGAVIDEARSARSWTYSQVAEKISVRLGKKYNYDDISAICTHVRQTSFEELKAIIDILNEDETAPKVSRTLALITRYPFLLVITGHVSNRPHIERKERSTLQFNTTQNHRLDPRGLPFLVRNRRFALGLDRRKAEEIFGMGTHIIDRVEADPSLDKVKNYPVGIELFQSILKMGIPLDQAIEAHEYSYWKNEPTLLTLRERSWTAPVFIDSRTLKRLRKFAEQPAGTFGEVLYAIRNSALPIYLSGKLRFPASPEDIGLFIGFPKTAWESWEQLRAEPSPDQISLILEKLNPSQEIRNKLSTKI